MSDEVCPTCKHWTRSHWMTAPEGCREEGCSCPAVVFITSPEASTRVAATAEDMAGE